MIRTEGDGGERVRRPTFDAAPCIWCGKAIHEPSLEHILPESMGCPPEFVLDGDVCVKCNNDLARLDRALLRPFELIAFLGNVPRKRGKRPSLDSLGAMRGRYTAAGPEIAINGGPGAVQAFGQTLKPNPTTKELRDLSFTASKGVGRIKFSQPIGDDPKFARALYKVAYEAAVFWLGPQMAARPELLAVRRFVRKGRGDFGVVLLVGSDAQDHYFSPPYQSQDTGHLGMGLRIFGVDFVLDFDPQQRLFERAQVELARGGNQNWTTIPPRSPPGIAGSS
jgi:hypothetical protein